MKKTICLMLSLLMLLSLMVTALADGTTTLTTAVPAATYTLNIPADQEIEFGALETAIDAPTITNAAGFAVGKNVNVNIVYSDFTSPELSTKIPIELKEYYENPNPSACLKMPIASNSDLCFDGLTDGTVRSNVRLYNKEAMLSYDLTKLYVCVLSSDWGKALGGDYTATITFTSEVVVDASST